MAENIQQEKEQQPNLEVKLYDTLRKLSAIPRFFFGSLSSHFTTSLI